MDRRLEIVRVSNKVDYAEFDIAEDFDQLRKIFRDFSPDVIYHLAQMPSAPYSMKSRHHCIWTHKNNLITTLNVLYAMRYSCPNSHLIKIGTMGEYGTPGVPIPEGKIEIEIDGYKDRVTFPRDAHSWYHQTKVHDTHNIRMACRIWGLRSTDIMQGIVYGSSIEETFNIPELNTRMDFDQYFGTVINRFVVQAIIGHPLTIYGTGGQVRSILPLQDSINCLSLLAVNPPPPGKYRELNQFHEYRSIRDMANVVKDAYRELYGSEPEIQYYKNPREEKEEHVYEPVRKILNRFGYVPSGKIEKIVRCMIIKCADMAPHLRNHEQAIKPTTKWSGVDGPVETFDN
jgi:UDP-sulfoquinovose synthase